MPNKKVVGFSRKANKDPAQADFVDFIDWLVLRLQKRLDRRVYAEPVPNPKGPPTVSLNIDRGPWLCWALMDESHDTSFPIVGEYQRRSEFTSKSWRHALESCNKGNEELLFANEYPTVVHKIGRVVVAGWFSCDSRKDVPAMVVSAIDLLRARVRSWERRFLRRAKDSVSMKRGTR